ncbi:MAG: hypothetical protein IT316_05700 [Anaerolineales bacterium]|nr:hypothetical protein [Anaerolineales bacterium]
MKRIDIKPRARFVLITGFMFLFFITLLSGCTNTAVPNPMDLESNSESPSMDPAITKTPTPTPPAPMMVDLAQRMDENGRLKEDIEVVSSDGNAKLNFSKGASILDSNHKPVYALEIRPISIKASKTDFYQVGWAYSIEPEGVVFDPPAKLTLLYSSENIPPEPYVNPRKPILGRFNAAKKAWEKLGMDVDLDLNIITADVAKSGIFNVLFHLNLPVPLS